MAMIGRYIDGCLVKKKLSGNVNVIVAGLPHAEWL